VLAYERGEGSYDALARLFDLNPRTLERWVARWRTAESVEPRPRGGGWRSPIDLDVLRVLVREGPDATLAEMCREYNRRVPRDFNPIEPAWGLVKRRIRDYEPRTGPALRRVARAARHVVTPYHCRQFFAHAGYGHATGNRD